MVMTLGKLYRLYLNNLQKNANVQTLKIYCEKQLFWVWPEVKGMCGLKSKKQNKFKLPVPETNAL